MGTALVYHEDMTAARLLWDDPECEIECPERLTTALERLQQRGLEQRCLQLAAREASEAELGLVHSPEYVALVRGTQALGTGELQTLSGQYDAVYFHPSTFHCARLAVGAALQLVDAVLAGAVRNGLALVRPPGHHSQRAAANGFCVFNNVAIAARHAQRQHGLHRILIVDWDVHHGQGIQYIFEDDPSVLYFSWHRYEHGRFWPYLRESDADAVGQGPGLGFTVNLPWNQVGMGNADYVAAFLHVLLPVAFEFNPELVLVSAGFDSAIGDPEGQMQATPECFAHLTQLLQVLAGGRVCAVLEGGYHLESLSQSVCMMVQALLGDPAPPLSGPMVPHGSALESIQSVRVAQAPHWMSLQQQGVAPVLSPRPYSPEGRPSSLLLTGRPEFKAAATQDVAALSSLLDQPRLNPTPPVRTAVALAAPDAALALPSDVLCEEGSAPQEETQAWARPHEALAQDRALTALGKVLYLLDRILDGQVSSGVAATPARAASAALDVAIRRGLSHGAQRLLCLAVGQLDRPPDLTDDGFQPDLVLVALGPAHGLRDPQAALLAALLRGPAGGRVLALVDEECTPQLVVVLARVLHGEAAPSLGPASTASPEDAQALVQLRGHLEPRWKMLQAASEAGGPGSG
ncbi:polyamine deacetylase HDAC10 isoform X4 [Lagenorhynchus albirostris]|uniref:polyamine deacetylase HDAC10 isoform X4 n=1 Tax=Lagenorhynchus albirostris TaxID=27610 RepID=UPI0028EEF435|nr:polyamine deacetylase HDAC10 isoform X4 [Lagenorhynchus albirostris]